MTGAIQSGLRAAHEVLWNLYPKAVDKKHLVGCTITLEHQ